MGKSACFSRTQKSVNAVNVRILLIALFIVLMTASGTFAGTYYVRKDGDDTKCKGTADASVSVAPDCAFLTVQKGVDAATTPGDIVVVHEGDYSAAVPTFVTKASGSPGNLITIQAYSNDIVEFSRVVIKHDYIGLNGIRIESPGGWGSEGINLRGSYCQITNNRVYNGYMGNPGSYGMNITGSNNLISGNIFEGDILTAAGTHTGANGATTLTDDTKNWADGVYIGKRLFNQTKQAYCIVTTNTSNTATCTLNNGALWDNGDAYTLGPTFFIVMHVRGNSNRIAGNMIRNIADVERVWDAYGDDNVVDGNEVYNIIWSHYRGIHPDIFQVVNTAGVTSQRWVIENNYFHDLDSQIGINEMPSDRSSGWIFRNNVFANITQRAMLANLNSKWYNNTFFQVQTGAQHVWDCNSAGVEFKNNILIGGSTSIYLGMYNAGDAVDFSNNFYSLPMDNGYTARNEDSIIAYGDVDYINGGDPGFVAAYNNCITNTCDFHLRADSPLIDRGIDLSGSWLDPTDFNGLPRPRGAGWDIGAYEYTPPPDSPSNLRFVDH